MKLVLILSHNCPVGHPRSESQAPGTRQHSVPAAAQLSPAAPDARPAQGSLSSLWSSLTLRLRGERRQRRQQRQQRESNHWRESREGWHNEGWPLGRAETGLHRQPGLSQRKYRERERERERERWSQSYRNTARGPGWWVISHGAQIAGRAEQTVLVMEQLWQDTFLTHVTRGLGRVLGPAEIILKCLSFDVNRADIFNTWWLQWKTKTLEIKTWWKE